MTLLDHGQPAFFLAGNCMTRYEKEVSFFYIFFITKRFAVLNLKLNRKIIASYVNKREQIKYNVQKRELK